MVRKINSILKIILGVFSFYAPPPLNKILCKVRGVKFKSISTVWIGMGTLIDNKYPELVFIGSNVTISFCVKLIAHAEPPKVMQIRYLPESCMPVHIGDNVFVGAGSIILPGVTIGQWSVIAAGSVVTKNVEPYTIVAGNPAKEIRKFDPNI